MLLRAFLALFFVLLTSCANFHGLSGSTRSHNLTAADYLNLAASTNNPAQKQDYLLSAAEQYLKLNQAESANKTLNKVDRSYLDADSAITLSLLRIYYRAETAQASLAIEQLAPFISNDALSQSNQILVHRILAKAYQQQSNIIASIDQMDQLQNLLNDSTEGQQNLLAIWAMVDHLSTGTLVDLANKTDSAEVRGWLDLAIIDNTYYTPTHFLSAIKNWKAEYPNHPAQSFIDSRSLILKQNPQKIALLLPLKGSLATSSEAIRNGFFAAFYYAKQHGELAPSITLYDTSDNDVVDVYQKALQQDADFVVGPLTKDEVARIAQIPLSVPTLALNSIQDFSEQRVSNLYQFDLSPISEATQVAEHARSRNFKQAVVFALASDWSQKIAKSFQQEWKSLGGRVVRVVTLENSQQLDAAIRQLLHVQVTHSDKEETSYRLAQKKDFDLVFLATSATQARQIVPLLRYYYNGYMPIYATSLIYDGSGSALRNGDLNGVSFCSMPWLIQPSTNLSSALLDIRNRSQSLWAASFNHNPKLYAVGADAYNLISGLNKLAIMPDLGLNGATGQLFLNNNHYINRELIWAEMHNGVAQPTQ